MAWFYWDPDPVFITIPFINHPIMWYGLLFATGFAIGYLFLVNIFAKTLRQHHKPYESKILARESVDKMAWYVVAGTIIGARLGHVFFYSWPLYRDNLFDIIKIWEGGLASHGGAIGVMIALVFAARTVKKKIPEATFFFLFDAIVVPTALVGAFIRMGNFFNQEVIGTETNMPWAVVFGTPFDGSTPIPRHPVQLYEAMFYLFTFITLFIICKKYQALTKRGLLSGLFFVMIFGFRFFVEFFKEPMSMLFDGEHYLLMGQYLSIPFIILGANLLFFVHTKKES
ncbi:MAG: prolipoprotein diacylglyceryl transferase [Waddliaceae bacterium]|nr:prolipoprotein diacylglyceryl transferase [Waddliaceae bacterium]